MLNSDRFLDAFNTIERYVRRTIEVGQSEPFVSGVHRASRTDSKVRHYRETLLEFAQLRNAIVHGPRGERVLAEPNDSVVMEIERIANLLTAPPSIADFMTKEVITIQGSEELARAVLVFREESFSQIPVYAGHRFTGLLTTTAVVRWLGKQLQNGSFSLGSVTVREILESAGKESGFSFMPETATAFDVIAVFERSHRRGERLRAVLVTDDGGRDSPLLGILTLWDLQAAYQSLEAGNSLLEAGE